MKTVFAAVSAAMLASCAFAATPLETAARNRSYAARYSDSIAVVRYWTKKNSLGEEPKLRVPYKCPNCNNTHYNEGSESVENGIPAEFAGFVIAPDLVAMQDLMMPPEFVDRIEVECAGETIGAVEFEACAKKGALVLKTERPFAAAKPLQFPAETKVPSDPVYFYLVREPADTVSGFAASKIADFKHSAALGRDFYYGNPNTLVLDEEGNPVTLEFKTIVEFGESSFAPPSAWDVEPAGERFARLDALEARMRRGVLPVYVQLEAKPKDDSRFSFRFSGSDEVKDDIDALGYVLEGGKVVIAAKLAASDTARLSKIEAALPDGRKVQLDFVGSHAVEGAFDAKFKDGVPEGVEPFSIETCDAIELWNMRLAAMQVANKGGKLEANRSIVRVDEFKRVKDNAVIAEFTPVSSVRTKSRSSDENAAIVLSQEGRLVELTFSDRRKRWSSNGKTVQGALLAAFANEPKYDLENIPRALEDRRRTPWLGVEVQAAGDEMVREKGAAGYVRSSRYSEAALVTEVAKGTSAEKLGIKPGDILLSVRFEGSSNEEEFNIDMDRSSRINWEEAFADDDFVEFASSGIATPWPDAEGGVNATLAKFGVGSEVVVSWVSDGVRKEGKTVLELAPVHFSNAPRTRNRELGITVCDMTHEVRKFFKLADDASGVVVAKVKSGGTAAVAGIKPLELILDVNGEDVMSAKDFLQKTKGKTSLDFTVRRLSSTRVVPVRL